MLRGRRWLVLRPSCTDGSDQGAGDTGDVAHGLAGVRAQRLPPRAVPVVRPADRVGAAGSRVSQRLAQPDAVGEAVRNEQAHSRTAVGERQHREVPFGSALEIQWCGGLFTQPGVEFVARPRCRDDLEGGPTAGRYPAITAELHRRALDAAG